MSLPVKSHPNVLASSRTLVVGGTSGLGAGVVSAILANGGSVFISSSNPKKIEAKINEFQALYPKVAISGTAADLSDENTLERNVKNVLEEATKSLGGPLDHLVYTAGDSFEGTPISSVDPKTYFRNWNVRYLAPLTFAKHIHGSPNKYLKVDAASSITLTSGVLAHKPIPGIAHFIGWAGAIETTTKALAIDVAPVRVNAVAPGAIYTEMLSGLGEGALQKFGEQSLVKRIGTVAEAAEAYLYAMRSAFVTAEVIKVDGGFVLA